MDYTTRIKDMADTIINCLHVGDVLDNMVSYCALTLDDRAFVDSQPTLTRKNRMFLEVILSRGDMACEVFIDLLRENRHYQKLVEKIDRQAHAYDEVDGASVFMDSDCTTNGMVPEFKVKLQKNYKKITSVKFQHMFDFLLAKDVLSFTDYEEISAQATLSDQNRKLIDLLMVKDEHAYKQFLETLRLGDKCLGVVEEIESTIVTEKEQKLLARSLSDEKGQNFSKLSCKLDALSAENQMLRTQVEKLKDPIPASVREHFKACIKDWEIEEERYFVTRATKHVLQLVETVNCVVVTGSSGNGKSALIHHVALQMQKERKFEIIPFVVDLSDIIRYCDPKKKQVFIIDDICGKVTVNVQTVDWWYTHLNQVEKLLSKGHMKLLASCRLQIYNDPKFRRLKQFFTNECNLLSPKFSVLPEERLLIAEKYFPKSLCNSIRDLMEMYDFFPLLCKLYHRRPYIDARMFFSKPIDGIREDLIEIQQKDKMQYCAIIMVILFSNKFKFEWLKPNSRSQETSSAIIDVSRECCVDLRTQSSRKEFKDHLDSLLKTYIKKSENSYRMIHDKIYDIGAVVCGQHLSECFINHADSTFVGDRFRFESVVSDSLEDETMSDDSSSDISNDDAPKCLSEENIIFLAVDEEEQYFNRLIEDLRKGITYSAFHNKQLHYQLYRSKFIAYCESRQNLIEQLLRQIEKEGQQLSERYYKEDDFRNIRLPLIESAFEGHSDIVAMLLDFKCEINLCDKYRRSALYVAAALGYLPVAQLLLNRGADTTLCNWMGQSALYSSCEAGHLDIVSLLLKSKFDTSKTDVAGRTPLFISCHQGHSKIVKLLLQKTTDGFVRDKAGRSPFFIACKNGHVGIVKLLFKKDFNLQECSTNGFSPLHIACQQGHHIIVQLLIEHKFDIHLCENNRRTAMHLACEGGHAAVVRILLQNGGSVSKRDMNGRSPLYTACEGGHASVVRLLLENNADITLCDTHGRLPLYAAAGWSHTEVVDLLLRNSDGCDLTKSDEAGFNALHVACYTGHVASVMLMLKHEFPVSKCDISGQTPLILACKSGHTEIVKILLNGSADILQCDNNGRSPLHVAAREGHLNTVSLLLEHDADPYATDSEGTTPWQMAWKGRHIDIVKLLTADDPKVMKDLL